MRRTTLIALLAALLLIIAGLALGNFSRVFANASLLCYACIGIG